MLARLRPGLPDRIFGNTWRRLLLAAYLFYAKPGCRCCPPWQTVVVCCVLCASKVEWFSLTILKEKIIIIIRVLSNSGKKSF